MDKLKKAMLEALEGRLGNVSKACKDCGVARSTHYLWTNTDPEYKAAVEEINEVCLDHVEDKLLQRINGVQGVKHTSDGMPIVYEIPPDTTAIIFFLKTRAKKRGYVEKQEVEHSGGIVWNETKTYDSDEKADDSD